MEGKNKIFCLTILPAIFLVGFYFSANFALAADDDLIITEIMYDPDDNERGHKSDWIEVFNPTDKEIFVSKKDLGFIDEPEKRDENGKLTNTCHTFDSDLTLRPSEYAIIADKKDTIEETYPDLKSPIIDTVVDLSQNGDTLKISFDRCKSWKIEISYSREWGGYGNNRSLEKIDVQQGNKKENWQESYTPGGTPGEKSSTKKTYPREIQINELLPNPSTDEEKNEFIELYNFGEKDTELENWTLSDKSGSFFRFSKNSAKAGKYLVIYRSDFKFALNNTDPEEVILKDPNGDEVSRVSYNEDAKEDFSYALNGKNYLWTSTPTPGAENIITAKEEIKPIEENLSSAEKVYLNEILPNPKGDERLGEFIELISREKEPVDLCGFIIRDGSKTGKYVFKDHIELMPEVYFVIYRTQSKISLNNSKESVTLYNPQGKIISSVSYDKSSENASYNFNGKNWRWSKFLTPGKENKFDSPPKVEIKKIKSAYKNLYTKFQVKAKDKETKHLKYIWDFGDGHKSYLKNTSHKYLKTGKYSVTLTVRDGSQSVEKTFSFVVRKYPRPKLEITRAIPNPAGLDSQNETITLKNTSSKKVNLLNYKIATGSEKLVNHPIYSDIILAPGEEKILTRVDSKIVLNNKAGKIALLYPDGKVADEIQYAKEKIEDDEAYAKIDGQWQWIAANNPEKNILADQANSEAINQSAVLGTTDEKDSNLANYHKGFTAEDAFIFFSRINFLNMPSSHLYHCTISQSSSLFAYLLASVF